MPFALPAPALATAAPPPSAPEQRHSDEAERVRERDRCQERARRLPAQHATLVVQQVAQEDRLVVLEDVAMNAA